ncbi:MAG: copper/silver-translocating P-type ATPase, partial [Bacillota bacterium]|nr:copper/silver-translocating P-type ATPase [Bacillota bacterium]
MEKNFKIEGMTCAACAKSVERVTKKLDGVTESNVNYATEKLSINFDESKVSASDIQAAIEKAGYKAVTEAISKTLKIQGMTCAACAKNVEKATKKLGGVIESNVNFATENLTISYEPSKVKVSEIKQAIEKAGYKAIEEEASTTDADKERKEKEIKSLWHRFIISAIFTLPLLYMAMGHMLGDKLGIKLPEVIDPMMNPWNFAIVQLILVLPSMIVGYKYFTIGFKSLFRGNPNMDTLIAIGTSAAFLYGIYAIYQINAGNVDYANELYFEAGGTILTLITLGKYLESVTKGKTSEAIKKLMGLAPKTAIIIKDGKELKISIDEVEVGDIIVVKP